MPIARFQLPDGRIGRFEVPDGTSPDEAMAMVEQSVSEGIVPPAEEDTSDFVRGIKAYAPQLKETFGGAEALLGKTIGSEGLLRSGIENIQEAQAAQQQISKPSDSLTQAWEKGIGTVLTDWLPYQAGQGVSMLAETLGVAGAGSLVAGPLGGVEGILSKSLVKKGIKEAADKILKDQGELAAQAFVQNAAKKEISELVGQGFAKQGAKAYGTTAGLAGAAGFHGAGETTSRAVEEAINRGEDPTQLDVSRILPDAVLHGLADYAAEKIGLKGFAGTMSAGGESLVKDIVKNIAITGAAEIPPELAQSLLERHAANLSLDDQSAIQEYIDTAGAAFGMGVVPGGIGGVRANMAAQTKEPAQPTDTSEIPASAAPNIKPSQDSVKLLESLQKTMEGGVSGRAGKRITEQQSDVPTGGDSLQVSRESGTDTAERVATSNRTAMDRVRDSLGATETGEVREPDTLETTFIDPVQKVEPKLTREQMAARDAAKREYEAKKAAELQAFQEAEPERAQAMVEAENKRIENLYPVTTFRLPPLSQDVVRKYNSNRILQDNEGVLKTLPTWRNLSIPEKSIFAHVFQSKGLDEAIKTLSGYKAEVKDSNAIELTPQAFMYEANRKTASKEHAIDFPSWNRLPESTREAFTTSLPSTEEGTVYGANIHSAYENAAASLEANNVAYRGMTKAAETEAQAKLQEKSSLNNVQRERQVEEAINQRKPWYDVLSSSALDTMEERVPGEARPAVTSNIVADRLLNTIKKADGDVDIQFATLENGEAGAYDPDSNTIYIDKNNLYQEQDGQPIFSRSLSEVVNHEVSHYALDHIVDNLKRATPAQRAAIKDLQNIHAALVNVPYSNNVPFSKEYNIGSFKEFLAEAMSNAAFQRDLAGIKVVKINSPSWKQLSKAERQLFGLVQDSANLLSAFMKRVARALGFTPGEAPVLERVLSKIETVLGDEEYQAPGPEMKAKGVSFAKAKQQAARTAQDIAKDRTASLQRPQPVQRTIKNMFTEKGIKFADRKFRNNRAPIEQWQKEHERSGQIIFGEKGFNNIYDLIVTSIGKANFYMRDRLDQPIMRLQNSVDRLTEAMGRPVNEVLGLLDVYSEALHEPERREVKYILNVPLSDKKVLTYNDKKISPADLREDILSSISKGVDKSTAAELRKVIDWLVYGNGSKTNKNGFRDAAGSSPVGYKTTDITSHDYNVIAGHNPNQVKQLQQDLDNESFKAQIMEVFDALEPLQEETIELNRKAGLWNDKVDGVVAFYGFKNYVPFKGTAKNQTVTKSENLEINGIRLANDLKPFEGKFAGRESESDNPILQSMKDATIAAARAGRAGLTEAVKNAIDQKLIPGKRVKKFSFEERYRGLMTEKDFNQRNRILHYNPDGSVEIYEITDIPLLEAIRRTYQESHPVLNIVNSWTGFIGQMHTRYNVSFPVLNFVRDVLTNAYVMAIDLSPGQAASYLGHVVTNTVPNMVSTFKISKMYGKGNVAGIRKLATTNKNAKDVLDYLESGGQISVVQGLTVQGQLEQMYKDLGRNKVIKTKEHVDKLFDVWVNTFELAVRSAAYNAAKSSLMAKGMSEDQAKAKATSYTKQLANFEEVGDWGRAMGAAFMFFRPSATGAARAIQALAPGLPGRSFDAIQDSISEDIKNNPEALENYKKEYNRQRAAAQKVTAALIGMGMVVYFASGMMSDDDDEERNKTFNDDMSRWTRYARFHIPGTDKPVQIPWGFGLGAFASAGAQIAAMANNPTMSMLDATGNLANIALDSFIPLPVSRMSPVDNFQAWVIDSITPNLLRPFVEHTMNINGLGQHIYNTQSRMADAYVGGDNVPDAYKDAAELLFNMTTGDISVTPNTLYFFANNYLDGISRIIHNGYGVGLMLSGQKEFDMKHDIPLIDSFIGSYSEVDDRNFDKVERAVEDLRRKENTFLADPDRYADFINKYPMAPAMVEVYDEIYNKNLKPIESEANMIRNGPMTPKEKSEALKMNKASQRMVKRAITDNYNMLKDYED